MDLDAEPKSCQHFPLDLNSANSQNLNSCALEYADAIPGATDSSHVLTIDCLSVWSCQCGNAQRPFEQQAQFHGLPRAARFEITLEI
jgi:hypothetical protein